MVEAKTTRASLLLRIRDRSDQASWSMFVEIYGPLVFLFAKRCGLQESDAADLVQEVMSSVAGGIGRFEYDPKLGRFRDWLYKIAKRSVYRFREKRQKQGHAIGGTDALMMMENQPGQDEFQRMWDREYRETLLGWAADKIRHQFNDSTWQAFWSTAVLGESPVEVAEKLGMSLGAVYVSKSRVLKSLAARVREIDDSQ